MKLLFTHSCHCIVIAMSLVALSSTSHTAAAEKDPHREAVIFEAEARVAALKALGQWVDVAVMQEPGADQPTLVHIRTDESTSDLKEVATRIRTVEVDCDKGLERLLMTQELDSSGAEIMRVNSSEPKFVPIDGVFTSPLRYACTGEYLLGLIPNGPQRVNDYLQKRLKQAAAFVPDRQVQVPRK